MRRRFPWTNRAEWAAAVAVAAAIFAVGCGGGSKGPSTQQVQSADAAAKIAARNAMTALEVYATDQGGSYQGATAANLRQIEPSVPADVEVKGGATTYTVTVRSKVGGNTFTASRVPSGQVERHCTKAGSGACPASGTW